MKRRIRRKRQIRGLWKRYLTWLILPLVCVFAIASCAPSQKQNSTITARSGDIVVGSKNFTEQIILGELLAQHIEATTKLKVDRKLNLGGTLLCHQALKAGQLDTYIEYSGTALTAVLKRKPVNESQQAYQQVKQGYAKQFQLEVTEPLGFNNTFAIMMRGEQAQRFNVKTISQLAQYAPQLKAGFGYEFLERPDGFPGLAKTYGLKFAEEPQAMDLGLTYRALHDKLVDVVAGDSTNGLIDKLNFVVLQDDKKYFPPYDAIPIIRKQTLNKYPELQKTFKQLNGLISEKEIRRLNYQVDGEQRDVGEVVKEFLQFKGLPNQKVSHVGASR
jgi:osmoprotectant transport system substrate-binding protein